MRVKPGLERIKMESIPITLGSDGSISAMLLPFISCLNYFVKLFNPDFVLVEQKSYLQTADLKGRRNLQISLGVRCKLMAAREREKEETLKKGLWESSAEIHTRPPRSQWWSAKPLSLLHMSESVTKGHITDRPLGQVMQTELSPHKEIKAHEEQVCYPRESELEGGCCCNKYIRYLWIVGLFTTIFPIKSYNCKLPLEFFSFGRNVHFSPRSYL